MVCLIAMAIGLGFGTVGPAAAQAPGMPFASLDEMKALSFLTGRWEGGGSIRMGPGDPHKFRGSEIVEPQLGGRILVIEGRHWADNPDQPVHHAFAVISWDAAAKRYRFDSHLADGRSGNYHGVLEDGAFVWFMDVPNAGRIRYTIRVEDDVWREIGEMQREDAWMPFFEMTLKKVS